MATNVLTRRAWLRAALGAGALSTLSGCDDLIRVLSGTCPENPADSGGIDWTPDVLHPVQAGSQDLDVADGAPGPLTIFYPTYSIRPDPTFPILKLCLVRYPVVLFLHGQPPSPPGCTSASVQDYYRRWVVLPLVLARSGYVVVVPKHSTLLPGDPESPDTTYVLSVLDWVRNGWEHRRWVDAQAVSTAIVGHSYGALLAARVRRLRPTISAYVGLSGPWTEIPDTTSVLGSIAAPSFFMWAAQAQGTVAEALSDSQWDAVPFGKTSAAFNGEHFDYLTTWPGCSFARGSCSIMDLVAAELVALFISRQIPVNLSHAPIPPSLIPPAVTLTDRQKQFAGGHLIFIKQAASSQGCSIDLTWNDPAETGSRHIGP
jgi:pimeloyl-ACP methyl ester carboxylesterase